jgi:KipI family sensor histidine kinase inhibitor
MTTAEATDPAATLTPPSILPLGDAALTIRLGDRVDLALAARVRDCAGRIQAAQLGAVREIVPAYAALTVFYDPARTGYAEMVRLLDRIVQEPQAPPGADGMPREHMPRVHRIPVRYDGADLLDVAARTGLTRDEVVARHSAPTYTVLLLGFVPGFAYLGELDPRLVLPRRAEPRRRVAAGSVAIAGAQTAVYPLETPGGWHLIGRTTTVLFDPDRIPPARLAPGDRVRFMPVDG